jgi:hypothetical protein
MWEQLLDLLNREFQFASLLDLKGKFSLHPRISDSLSYHRYCYQMKAQIAAQVMDEGR